MWQIVRRSTHGKPKVDQHCTGRGIHVLVGLVLVRERPGDLSRVAGQSSVSLHPVGVPQLHSHLA